MGCCGRPQHEVANKGMRIGQVNTEAHDERLFESAGARPWLRNKSMGAPPS